MGEDDNMGDLPGFWARQKNLFWYLIIIVCFFFVVFMILLDNTEPLPVSDLNASVELTAQEELDLFKTYLRETAIFQAGVQEGLNQSAMQIYSIATESGVVKLTIPDGNQFIELQLFTIGSCQSLCQQAIQGEQEIE